MLPGTHQVITSIKSTPTASKAYSREAELGNGQAFQSPTRSGINKATKLKEYPETDIGQTATRSNTSGDESYPASHLADSLMEKNDITDIKSRHYFLKFW